MTLTGYFEALCKVEYSGFEKDTYEMSSTGEGLNFMLIEATNYFFVM